MALLVASPAATADVTLPLLLLAFVPLAALVIVEHRCPMTPHWVIVRVATGLVLLAVGRPPHGSNDVSSYAMYGRIVCLSAAVMSVAGSLRWPAAWVSRPSRGPPSWLSGRRWCAAGCPRPYLRPSCSSPYFAGVLPVAALDGEEPLPRLLGVQTIAVLIAYQRQALPGGDGLDAVLSKATAGAQVIAVSASVVFLAGALAAARNRRLGTPALPAQMLH